MVNYQETGSKIKNAAIQTYDKLVYGNAEAKGEVTGHGLALVAEAIVGSKGVGLLSETVQTVRLESTLTKLAGEAQANVTNSTGLIAGQKGFGTAAHSEFKSLVDAKGLKNVATEKSFLNIGGTKQVVNYGTKGSSRADIVLMNKNGTVKRIYDFKTGNASLTSRQVNRYINNVPGISSPSQIKPIR